jgi:acyl carrier protein phosphodiesterase
MKSESKETRLQQQTLLETKLKKRLAILTDKGVQEQMIVKDALVKQLKARLNKTSMRLRAIEALAKRTEDLSARKAERLEKPKVNVPKVKKGAQEKQPEPKPKKKTKPPEQT